MAGDLDDILRAYDPEERPITTQDIVAHTPQPSWFERNAGPAIDMWRNAEAGLANATQQFNERAAGDLGRLLGRHIEPEEMAGVNALIGGVKTPERPSIWYRGTPHMDRLLNQQELTPEGLKGTYFTSDPQYAAGYGPVRGYNVKGSIKDVYLPDPDLSKDVDAFDAWDAAHDAELTRAHHEGHAGVRLWEREPGGKDWEEREMILFDPKNAGQPVRIPNPIKPVFHGSPYDFKPTPGNPLGEFDLSKVGTGEGAQAYGHGLYFAEHEPVARQYRDTLEQPRKYLDPEKLNDLSLSPFQNFDPDAVAMAKELLAKHGNNPIAANQEASQLFLHGNDTARLAGNLLASYSKHFETLNGGRMYEVALHATPESFLDWDKPLSPSQEATVLDVAKRTAYGQGADFLKGNTGKEIMQALQRGTPTPDYKEMWPPSTDRAIANNLREAGIPGVRYLDQNSRFDVGKLQSDVASWEQEVQRATSNPEYEGHLQNAQQRLQQARDKLASSQGTSNYVVWSPEIIEILRKYGLIPPVAAAALYGHGADEQ